MKHEKPIDRAREKYETKRVRKFISFNTETEKELLKKANGMDNFSVWVKDKLRDEDKENDTI